MSQFHKYYRNCLNGFFLKKYSIGLCEKFGMPITLYMEPLSPPSRAVMMTAEAINLNLEYKRISLAKKDNLRPDFLKMNVQHTVPTLVDESTTICDSHAIMTYLVSKYGRDDALYPKDLKKRALVDQRLHFDSGSLFCHAQRVIKKCLSKRGRNLEEHEKEVFLHAYNLMEQFLDQFQYIAGDSLTVADFSVVTSATTLNIMLPIDATQFPKLSNWIKTMECLPFYQKVNEEGLQDLKDFLAHIGDFVSS